jgi:hypothetical protein
LVTAVYLAGFARSACIVVYDWLNDYAVAFFVLRDSFANGLDNAAEFMAKGHGH